VLQQQHLHEFAVLVSQSLRKLQISTVTIHLLENLTIAYAGERQGKLCIANPRSSASWTLAQCSLVAYGTYPTLVLLDPTAFHYPCVI
jgi:biotin carboxylase